MGSVGRRGWVGEWKDHQLFCFGQLLLPEACNRAESPTFEGRPIWGEELPPKASRGGQNLPFEGKLFRVRNFRRIPPAETENLFFKGTAYFGRGISV